MKPYPETKNSGIDWISDIPIHWNVHRTDHHFDHIKERNTKNDERVVLSLSYGKVVRRNIETNFGLLPESFDSYQVLNPGDIVLRLTDLQNDKRSLRVGLSKDRGIITSAYVGLRAKSSKEHSPYFYFLFNTYDIIKVFYTLGGGVRQSMRFEDVRRIPLLIPPLPEQQQIVSFLDSKTFLITKIIENKTHRIQLLKEMRSSLISEVVTKGLNPDVPMKESGVEWIGDVPSHWTQPKLRYLVVDDWGGEVIDKSFWGDGPELLYTTAKLPVRSDFSSFPNKKRPKETDLLLARNGDGTVHVPTTGSIFTNVVQLVRLRDGLDRRFLRESLVSQIGPLHDRSDGDFITSLNKERWFSITVPLPPLSEQQQIVSFIDEKTMLIDQEIGRENDTINHLQELRQSLIHEVVTGKTDVRGVETS